MEKGYILAVIEVADATAYRNSGYMEMAEKAVAAQGGKFLIRGGDPETLEGDPVDKRTVMLEFPSRAAALAFYRSEIYAPAITLRQSLSKGTLTLLTGLEP